MFVNPRINGVLEVLLNKNPQDISQEDITEIQTIAFTKAQEDGQQVYSINEVLNFQNLKHIYIESSEIFQEDIEKLSQIPTLSSIEFSKCILDSNLDFSNFAQLRNLTVEGSYIEDPKFLSTLNNLKKLAVIFPYNEEADINISDIKCGETLEELRLEGCCIENATSLSQLPNLKVLNFLSTEVPHFEFIDALPQLNQITVEPRYASNEKLQIPSLVVHTSDLHLVMDDKDYSRKIV